MLYMSTCDRDAPSIVMLTHVIVTRCIADACRRVGRNTDVLLHKCVQHLPSCLFVVTVRDTFQKWECMLVIHLYACPGLCL